MCLLLDVNGLFIAHAEAQAAHAALICIHMHIPLLVKGAGPVCTGGYAPVAVHTLVSLEHEIGGRLLLQRAIAQRQAGNGGDIGIAVLVHQLAEIFRQLSEYAGAVHNSGGAHAHGGSTGHQHFHGRLGIGHAAQADEILVGFCSDIMHIAQGNGQDGRTGHVAIAMSADQGAASGDVHPVGGTDGVIVGSSRLFLS